MSAAVPVAHKAPDVTVRLVRSTPTSLILIRNAHPWVLRKAALEAVDVD